MKNAAIHLIAEAGTNHNGDVATGKRLIREAAQAGADSVKFQMIFPEGLYLPIEHLDGKKTRPSEVYRKRQSTALGPDDFRELAAYCKELGVGFSASVFDQKGIDLLDELNAPYVKIASCDLNNSPLIQRAAATARTLVISTGMSQIEEIEQALNDARNAGAGDIVIMHCVSVYPCPTNQANVGFLDTLRDRFDCAVGYSDHTESGVAAAIAIAKGASWIEKHITLDRSCDGFDHAYAMELDMFASYAADISAAWQAIQPPAEKVGADERNVRCRARRGLYASRRLEPGTVLDADDVLIVRPESGLGPNALYRLTGKTATKTIEPYAPLEDGMFA